MLRTLTSIILLGMSTSSVSAEHETQSGVKDEDYGRILPFFGDRVRDMGIKLPKPIGISLFTHQQEDLMQLGDFKIDGESVDDILPNGGSQTTNTTSIVAVRGDVWVLPFWGFNAMIGKAVTSSDIAIGISDFSNGNLERLEINGMATSSTITAVGTTLAYGHKQFFTTVDAQYVSTSVSGVGVSLDALVVTPLIGLNIGDSGWRIVVGGQYQDYQRQLKGQLGDIRFSAKQTSSRWSTMVGMQKAFTDNWEASLMAQSGKTREGFTFMLGKRF
ncbi:hypothetical protein J4N45_22580 [Vibrio sp. SCSIO 43140]|uniref:hypothetical protein n=1 Tax=Vibrio sp. SCSIO 43140 TaxID=2819100 RepID=UPI002074FCE0|nr:hypothetical protein [Vibrio sp. SCSIO 43140]USD63755.1 hypothetical protein J4N45_22580 [Vibrio sp. SCSIO 43140]